VKIGLALEDDTNPLLANIVFLVCVIWTACLNYSD